MPPRTSFSITAIVPSKAVLSCVYRSQRTHPVIGVPPERRHRVPIRTPGLVFSVAVAI